MKHWLPSEIRKDGVTFTWEYNGIPGSQTLYAIHKIWPCPVGMLYYSQAGKTMTSIDDLYVTGSARRSGVATALLQKLIELFPGRVIITSSGSAFGKPWLKAMGFKQELPYGWILRPK